MDSKLLEDFYTHFGKKPVRQFVAPGRINIIGEHVDYLGGKVLPAAIHFSINIIACRTSGSGYKLYSQAYNSLVQTDSPVHETENTWANYIHGVVDEFQKRNLLIGGFEMAIGGNIPEGAGLSSSAALEVGVAFALNELFELNLDKKALSLLAKDAENYFIGLQCGIMDQFASAFGKENHCILLDTASLQYEYHPAVFEGYELFLIDSKVKHSLKDSAYNTRRKECDTALMKIREKYPEVQTLYMAEEKHLEGTNLSPVELKRVLHVIGERKRTINIVDSLSKNDILNVGKHILKAHASLSELFEVSCPETDFLVNFLSNSGTVGARMIGGGFGGCVLAIEKTGEFSGKEALLRKAYKDKFGIDLQIYNFRITDGVREIGR